MTQAVEIVSPTVVSTPAAKVPPCAVVIFGGGGDLARRKLIPALYNLRLDGVLPQEFCLVGVARTERSDDSYRDMAREGVQQFSRQGFDERVWEDFGRRLFYLAGSFGEAETHARLRAKLDELDASLSLGGNRLFYLSIPPSGIEACVQQLREAGMVRPVAPGEPTTRVIVEKPIGHDYASALAINATLAAVFDERQVFRIDHYLGKETVQNIMVLRFANSLLEPLWNQKHIDHVQITVSEEEGVGTRAGYYEEAGSLRDMVQNHLLQLVSLTAMEPPWSLAADVVRDHKLEVLQCLRPVTATDIESRVVRAQYAHALFGGEELPGYRREEGVAPGSITETYVALKVHIDNWRWSGVPFYLRTGKRLPKRASEIAVQFRDVPQVLFNANPAEPLLPNVLAIRLQPDEGMSLRISAKRPGPKVRISPVKMDFGYVEAFGKQSPEAYERLLLDVMVGDATLFMRRDAVEASWQWIESIIGAWRDKPTRYLPEYPAGSWGPVEADRMIEADGRHWRVL